MSRIIIAFGIISLMCSCGLHPKKNACEKKEDSTAEEATPVVEQDPASSEQESTDSSIPDVQPTKSQFVFKLDETIDMPTVKGYVVGFAKTLTVRSAAKDQFFIDEIPPGKAEVVILAKTLSEPRIDVGIRLSDIQFENGMRTKRETVILKPLVPVSGIAKLMEYHAPNFAEPQEPKPISISILGIDGVVSPDANGHFVMANVPQGNHSFVFEAEGYRKGRFDSIDVGSALSLDDMILVEESRTDGFDFMDPAADQKKITLVLNLPKSETEWKSMKLAKFGQTDVQWQPIRTAMTLDILTDNDLAVRFLNAAGEESDAFGLIVEHRSSNSLVEIKMTGKLSPGTSPASLLTFYYLFNIPSPIQSMLNSLMGGLTTPQGALGGLANLQGLLGGQPSP